MESSPGEVEGNTEDLTGRKKSRFKFLKTRLFGRLKKKENEGQMKQSKSTNDVTAQEGRRGEEDDCQYPQGTLSSRALSHDSIFLADQSQLSEPTRVLSQENVHGKIKALQLKLQQQNMRLGPLPLLIPGKRFEDSGATSEDDGLPCSPPEMSFQEMATHRAPYKLPEAKKHHSSLSLAGTGSEEEEQVMPHPSGGSSQPPSRPLSPVPRLSPQEHISLPSDFHSTYYGVDFSSPAHYVSCLDNSAARHRMSIKPRNQRASTKRKNQRADVHRPRSSSLNNLDQSLSEEEEVPQSASTAETIHNQSFPPQVTNLEEKITLPVSVSHPRTVLQKEAMELDVGLLSRVNEILKSDEPSQLEDRITTIPISFLQETTENTLTSRNYIGEQLGKEPLSAARQSIKGTIADVPEGIIYTSLALQAACPEVLNKVTVCTVTEERTSESVDLLETLRKSAYEDVSPSLLTRSHPVPAPRTKKPALDKKSSTSQKITNAQPREVEKETNLPESNKRSLVSSESLNESSVEDDKLHRPSSFRFSITSAKYRCKTISAEQVTKQEEESSSNVALLKNPSTNMEPCVEKLEKEKNNQNTLSTPDNRISLQRVVPKDVSKESCLSTSDEMNEKAENCKESRGLFGVKLRATSLSLKYRSDVAKSEDKTKRHSLDAHQMLTVSEAHGKEPFSRDTEEFNTERRSNILTNNTSLKSDSLQDLNVDTGSSREANSGYGQAWMSLAWDKSRAHQPSLLKSSTHSAPTPSNSASSSTTLTSCNQQRQRPTPHPRPHLRSTEKAQLRACHSTELQLDHQSSLQTPPKPAPRMERRPLTNQSAVKSTSSQSTNGAEPVDVKVPTKPGMQHNTQTEPDSLRRTPAFTSPSLSHQQSPSDRGQPSWMELAKRKSLAWSDRSLE